jgi:predicted transcriptional regulator
MKTLTIRIEPADAFWKEMTNTARAIDQKAPVAPSTAKGTTFASIEAIRQVLTEHRLQLWRIIRDQHPKSISELARVTQRDFKNVHADVQILTAYDLVTLQKKKGSRGDVQQPVSRADRIRFEVA